MRVPLLFAVVFAAACATASGGSAPATATAQKMDAQACSPLVPAVVARGTEVYPSPDTSGNPIAKLNSETPVCASATSQGFGLSRIKLSDGRTGFVDETSLSF
jgi:hypothetical protein